MNSGRLAVYDDLAVTGGKITAYPVEEVRHLLKSEDPALRRTETGFTVERRFFRHGNVTCAAGRNDDLPDAVGLGKSTVKPDACFCKVCDVECGFDLGSSLFGKTRDQDAFLPVIDHRLHDPDDLRRCFSRTIDHLGCALQDTSVRIHFRISEVIKRRGLQLQESFLRSDIAALK